jgi:hypothetical protein
MEIIETLRYTRRFVMLGICAFIAGNVVMWTYHDAQLKKRTERVYEYCKTIYGESVKVDYTLDEANNAVSYCYGKDYVLLTEL